MFELHSQLMKDCRQVGDLPLCRVLLMDDSRYPWLILVPRRERIIEVFELSTTDQRQLMDEISGSAAALAGHARADKMNVAALGNIVPQLHVHVVARRIGDTAWPGPVWGVGEPSPYAENELANLVSAIAEMMLPLGLQASFSR